MHAPTPVAPNNVTIDAHAASFSWTLVPDATDHEVAVGSTHDFVESVLEIGAGPTDSLILYETLPEDGTKLFWKVRAKRDGTWGAWSDTVPFISGSEFTATDSAINATTQAGTRDQHLGVVSSGTAKESGPQAHTQSTSMPSTSAPAPTEVLENVDGTTSAANAVGYMMMMIVSFVLLMFALVMAVPK